LITLEKPIGISILTEMLGNDEAIAQPYLNAVLYNNTAALKRLEQAIFLRW
jgi:hypothetical protein